MPLNTERSYKRQGHAPLRHFVGSLCNGGKPEQRSHNIEVVEKLRFFRQTNGVISMEKYKVNKKNRVKIKLILTL